MEITLDVGKNIVNEIEKIAATEKNDFDIVALKVLDLGLRVYQSANTKSDEVTIDPVLGRNRHPAPSSSSNRPANSCYGIGMRV